MLLTFLPVFVLPNRQRGEPRASSSCLNVRHGCVGACHSPDLTGGGVRSRVPRSFFDARNNWRCFHFFDDTLCSDRLYFCGLTRAAGRPSQQESGAPPGPPAASQPTQKASPCVFCCSVVAFPGDFRCVFYQDCGLLASSLISRDEEGTFSVAAATTAALCAFCVKVILSADVSVFLSLPRLWCALLKQRLVGRMSDDEDWPSHQTPRPALPDVTMVTRVRWMRLLWHQILST